MSSLPGLLLEDFVAWNFSLVVEEQNESNISVGLAEFLGTTKKTRRNLSKLEFLPVIKLFEQYRERVEERLLEFEEGTSWRDYAGWAFEFIPNEIYEKAEKIINQTLLETSETPCRLADWEWFMTMINNGREKNQIS